MNAYLYNISSAGNIYLNIYLTFHRLNKIAFIIKGVNEIASPDPLT